MEKFLTKVARHILHQHGNNLSDITVLMPNHRSCIYLRQELTGNARQVIWSPEIITLRDWIFEQSELSLIEPLEQLIELYDVYKEKGGEDTLDEFLPTGQMMLADFDEVDLQMADARAFFNYLERLQSLKVYEPGGEPTEYSIRYKKFWQLFRELYFGFRERMLKQKKGYAGMLYRQVADPPARLGMTVGKNETILFPPLTAQKSEGVFYMVGFSGLSKSEEQIVKKIGEKHSLEIIHDSDNYYVKDGQQEAGFFFRKYKDIALDGRKNGGERWQGDLIATREMKIHIIGVAKNIGQTKVMADLLANKLGLDAQTESQTAVIVPDEKLLNPALGAIPGNISSLNVSIGYPLNESPIAELMRSLFALHENSARFQSKKNPRPRFYHKDVFDLLNHPYATYLIPDKKAINGFIENMRRFNRAFIGLDELNKYFAGTGYEKLFWITTDAKEYIKKLLQLIDSLRILFLTTNRTGEQDLSIDMELLFHFNSTLVNLQNILPGSGHEMTALSLQKLISNAIRLVRIPFDGEPVKGLQLMGLLETQCLDFKNVIILSMNEGIFPAGKSERSYIPYEMRKEFLSTYREKDAISAYLFYRLLQRSENIYLLYNTESDELGGGERSRYILQLQHELKQANPNAKIEELVYSVDPVPSMAEDEMPIVKDKSLMQKLLGLLTGYGISPSAINSYIHCSLQYYLRYVAELREQEDVEEGIEAATLGSAVHSVLEDLYKPALGKELSPDFVAGISADKKRIQELLRKAFAGRFEEESLSRGKNYLLYRVCLKLIDEFLKQEKNNLKLLDDSGSKLNISMLENEMVQPLKVGAHEIKIRGKVDRVEESNGIVSVADYKTGSPFGSSIKGDDIQLFATDPKYSKAMQLLTYAWLYWKSNGSAGIQLRSGIYWLRDTSKGFDSLKIDKDDHLSATILLQFEEVLKNVLSELLNPEIPFTKTKEIERCANCEFIRICGRD